MRKPFFIAPTILLAGAVLLGSAVAQQSTTKNQAAPAKPQSTPAPAKTPDAPAPKAAATSPFTNQKDKVSYAIGMNIGSGIHRQSVDVNPDMLAEGIKDAIAGKTKMTEEEARAAIAQLQADMRAKQAAAVENNKKEGEAFLATNKTKESVVALPSGLQYKILKAGAGPKPTAADTVVCSYRGTLINGKEFDSSQSATFAVGGVIKGWTEALQLMAVGSKWQLFVPPDLAYGARGTPDGTIGPNETLIFEVELLSIQPKDAPK
jgi:FKBP-type peptidyl-prolyl cis-trans isomerase